MDSALVSIIVPVYNTAEYVEECIQSILLQTYENIELILVNDGSTDGSGEICKKYGHLPNVSYIEQGNTGVVGARKQGVEKASGEWIMFVDSDDLIYEHSVEKLLDLSDGCDIVIGRFQWASKSNEITESKLYDHLISRDDYLYKIFSHTGIDTALWAKIFNKHLVKNSPLAFEYNVSISEDYLMNLAIAINNRKYVKACNDIIYNYRRRHLSAVNTFVPSFDYYYKICNWADSIVMNSFPTSLFLEGTVRMRMFYYYRILKANDYQGDCHHPFVRQIIKYMNKAKMLRLTDRLFLSVSNKEAFNYCLFIRKIIVRIKSIFFVER